MAIKRDYLVTRPFIAIDRSGNSITIRSKEVSAYVADDHWVRGEAGGLKFGVLESVFREVAIPKHPQTIAEAAFPTNPSVIDRQRDGRDILRKTDEDMSKPSLRCPKCESNNTRPSNRRTRSLLQGLWMRPYRCQSCDERFLCPRWKS